MPTALVTGGARGIGRATARAFLGAGFRVLALDRDFEGVEPEGGDALAFVRYDLADLAGIPALVATLGRIDVLVNNAGIQAALPYERYTEAARQSMIRVNLEAPVELIRAVATQMVERRAGRIVSLASIASYTAHPDLWYGITKAGVVSLTRSFASYLGAHGVLVNAVAPGPIDTDLLGRIDATRRETLLKTVYTRRAGRPEEVAAVILWLGSTSPQYLNGAVIDVNDGTFPR